MGRPKFQAMESVEHIPDEQLRRVLAPIVDRVLQGWGESGDPLDQFLTRRDLQEIGTINTAQGGTIIFNPNAATPTTITIPQPTSYKIVTFIDGSNVTFNDGSQVEFA